MPNSTIETRLIDHTAATGKGTIKGSLPEYREGAETPGFKQVLEYAGVLSRESLIRLKTPGGAIQGSERPLSLRRARRELMGRIKHIPTELSGKQKQEIEALNELQSQIQSESEKLLPKKMNQEKKS